MANSIQGDRGPPRREIISAIQYSGMSLSSPRTNDGGCSPDLPPAVVRDHVAHILRARGFARSERLKRFLSFTVERVLAGDTGDLKEYVIALEVFDRSPDYNPKVDAVVRVEARRLRLRLEQYYATEGLQDSIRIQFPSGTYVPVIGRTDAPERPERPLRAHPVRRWGVLTAGFALIAILVIGSRVILRSHAAAGIVRIVRDSAAAFDPCVSRDGRMLAYASDQSGNVDLWVRTLDGGEARRLTSDQSADSSPDFSPDSSRIVFRSERNGGGAYVIPVAGGLEHLVIPLARSPKFSPDGNYIAYWTGEAHHFEGKTFVVAAGGERVVRVGADLADAKRPVWSSDGRALLVYGSRASPIDGGAIPGPMDLFLVPLDGGAARETGWTEALRRANLWSEGPVSWDGAVLQFSAATGSASDMGELSQGVANLWRISLPQHRGRVEGEPKRVTFGAALEQGSVLLPGGDAILASTRYTLSAFEVSLNGDAESRGMFRPLFSGAGSYLGPRLSRDNSTLVAISDRSGQVDIWLKDLRTGEERAVTSTTTVERGPQISSDGSTVFFGVREGPLYPTYKMSARGGAPQRVCADCGALADISPDDKYLLYHRGDPWSAYALNLSTGNRTLIAGHKYRTYSSRFSPDGKWITFQTDSGRDEAPRQIFVAPFMHDHLSPEPEWIPITDGRQRDFAPCWSADGAILYFLSDRDGNRCIWAMHVNRQTKHPVGNASPVIHLHRMATHIPGAIGAGALGISAGNGRLIFGAAELSSTIYRMDSPR
jgi:eukaryotic-like serine/threonine-protein kinase